MHIIKVFVIKIIIMKYILLKINLVYFIIYLCHMFIFICFNLTQY